MRKIIFAAFAALMLVLAACQAPNTEVSSSLPIESPVNSLEPISSEEVNGLPDFLSDFTLDHANGFYMDDDTHYYVHLPDSQKAQQIVSAFDMENWTEVGELPAVSFTVSYNFYDSKGNMISLAPWSPLDEEYCLFSCFSADGSTTVRYHVPRAVYDNVDALLDNSSYLGDISYDASYYYDLFQRERGIIPLVEMASEDGSFSDDQIIAYATEQIAYEGNSFPASTAAYDSTTLKHFGRTIANIEIPAQSYNCGMYLALDGEPVENGGVITARFKCYTLNDSIWFDGDIDQEKLTHIKEYLLTGNDEDFPEPQLVEIVFETQFDVETQTSYVFYHSLKVLN